jgi:hypothetical protein
MPASPSARQTIPWWSWALHLLLTGAGLWWGFGFGREIGGWLFGGITALNAGLLGFLTASAIADRLLRRQRLRDAAR